MHPQAHYRARVVSFLLIALLSFILLLQGSILAIARGYTTDDNGLQTGMIAALSIDSSSGSKVERATQDSSDRVVGVVTTIDNSLVSVGSASTKVFVESEGQVDAYVSDINGEVSQGDTLVLSPLKGVLMKSKVGSRATIIALAATGPGVSVTYPYEEDGEQKQTNISKISVNLNRQGQNAAAAANDSALARLGRSIVGKEVGEIRVLIALIIFILVLITEGGIVYGAISSAITALGRNPLARKIIRTELIRVVAIAIIVLLVGLGAVYVVLWI